MADIWRSFQLRDYDFILNSKVLDLARKKMIHSTKEVLSLFLTLSNFFFCYSLPSQLRAQKRQRKLFFSLFGQIAAVVFLDATPSASRDKLQVGLYSVSVFVSVTVTE